LLVPYQESGAEPVAAGATATGAAATGIVGGNIHLAACHFPVADGETLASVSAKELT
jgi:hypothetical protein